MNAAWSCRHQSHCQQSTHPQQLAGGAFIEQQVVTALRGTSRAHPCWTTALRGRLCQIITVSYRLAGLGGLETGSAQLSSGASVACHLSLLLWHAWFLIQSSPLIGGRCHQLRHAVQLLPPRPRSSHQRNQFQLPQAVSVAFALWLSCRSTGG